MIIIHWLRLFLIQSARDPDLLTLSMTPYKKLFFPAILSVIILSQGCALNQQPVDMPGGTGQASQLTQTIESLEHEITRLKQQKKVLENQLARSESHQEALHARIIQLEKRIDFLVNQLSDINESAYQSEIAKLKKQEHALKQQISFLNASLRDIHAQSTSGQEATPEDAQMIVDQIQSSIQTLKSDLRSTTERKKQLQAQIDSQRAEIKKLEKENASITSMTQAGFEKAPLSLDKSEKHTPEIVEVFYGTNRQRLTVTWMDLVKPFVFPFLLIAAILCMPIIIRAILKDHLQRPTILFTNIAIVAAFVYLTISAIQTGLLQWQSKNTLTVQYGPDRLKADKHDLPFELGIVKVSIPPTHQPGVVELPSLMYLELKVDPEKHFVMADIQPYVKETFFSRLRHKIAQSDDKDMFVFVHGFHNTFENAAFRTAQIAYDMKFTGAPVFFSWPSQGSVVDYPTDESNAGAAVHDLRVFLTQLIRHSNADRIHLIAHSMGNRVLTRAVKGIALVDENVIFNEVVLAAPDMDAKTFSDIMPEMAKRVDRVTLYASSRDKALVVSNVLHGEYPRAGESVPHPVVVHPVESIDVSSVTDGHSYIADDGQILQDLNNILKYSRPLNESIARLKTNDQGASYWELCIPCR